MKKLKQTADLIQGIEDLLGSIEKATKWLLLLFEVCDKFKDLI